MQTTTDNSESTDVIIKPTENLSPQHILYVKKNQILGSLQIWLGGILVILSSFELAVIGYFFAFIRFVLPICICSGWVNMI